MSMFRPASRKKLKLRACLCGPSGSGKTFTGLRLAFAIGGKVAVIDTEHRSAEKYQGLSPDGQPWQFDVCELAHFSPSTYTQCIREAAAAGYEVLLIDSLSHAWEGVGGALDLVDKKSSGQGGNSFTAWKDVTPLHREMVEAILAAPLHIIATMRTKMEYTLEEQTAKNGRKVMVPKKVGMQPIQRQGMEYEFDIVADFDETHTMTVSKTRCPSIDGQRIVKPDAAFMRPVLAWLGEGEEAAEGEDARPQSPASNSSPTADAQPPQTGTSPQTNTSLLVGPSEDGRRQVYDHEICTPEQVRRIKDGFAALNLTREQAGTVLQKRGVTRIGQLTVQQATELILNLEAKAAENDCPF